MTWIKIDCSFPRHPKLSALPERYYAECLALWMVAACYCGEMLTDGKITDDLLRKISPFSARKTTKLTSLLVETSLFYRSDNLLIFNDWEDYQQTANQAKQKRKADRERQQKRRRSQEMSRRDKPRESRRESRRLDVDVDITPPVVPPRGHPAPSTFCVPSSDSDDPEERSWGRLISGYARRYEQRYATLWGGLPKARTDVRTVARWAARQAAAVAEGSSKNVLDVVDDLCDMVLDGYFADESKSKRRHPWSWLAEDPARYLPGGG